MKKSYILTALLALTGLALILIPNGMRFTGWLLLWTAAAWILGLLVCRWSKRSKAGKICKRLFFTGLAVGLSCLISIEMLLVRHGESDNSALPADAVIVLGAGVNGETPSAALW